MTTTYISDVLTLFAAIIGFIGVIVTLRGNAKNAREAEERKFNQERHNVIGALLAELRYIEGRLSGNKNAMEKVSEKGVKSLQLYFSNLRTSGATFEKYLPQVGHLDVNTITAVHEAYETVKSVPDYLIMVAQAKQAAGELNFLEVHNLPATAKLLEDPIEKLGVAISCLEAELKKQPLEKVAMTVPS